mgnify:CR=1 FL=1
MIDYDEISYSEIEDCIIDLQNINGGTVKVLRDFCETLIAGHFGIHAAPLSQ